MNVKVPAALGVPLIVLSPVSKVTPVGSVPSTAHVYVPPSPPDGRQLQLVRDADLGARRRLRPGNRDRPLDVDREGLVVGDAAVDGLHLEGEEPSAVGVPERSPLVESVTPAGSAPETTDQVALVAGWPAERFVRTVAVSCSDFDWLRVQYFEVTALSIRKPGLIVMVNSRSAVFGGLHQDCDGGFSSLSSTQKFAVPAPCRRAADQAARRQREPCGKPAVQDLVLVRQRRPTAAFAIELHAVRPRRRSRSGTRGRPPPLGSMHGCVGEA